MTVYKSKAMQAIQAKKASSQSSAATEIAKLRTEVSRLTRKVQELMGERGDNPAVRKKELDAIIESAITNSITGGA